MGRVNVSWSDGLTEIRKACKPELRRNGYTETRNNGFTDLRRAGVKASAFSHNMWLICNVRIRIRIKIVRKMGK